MKYLYYLLLSIFFLFSIKALADSELKVAIIIEPPFTEIKEDKLVGYNVEIAKVLAKSIALSPVFIQCPFARCLSMLEQGKADLMIGLSKLPTREKNLLFIEPALSIQDKPLRLYTLAERSISIKDISDLDKLIVGTLRGASYFPQFDKSNSIKKIEFTSREQLVSMLLKGRIDTFFDREESIRPLLSNQKYQNEITLATYQHGEPVKSYIAISKHSHISSYSSQISHNLTELISHGKIHEIEEKCLKGIK
jgi:ABC-type amino acid transport substrate-binding protein